MVKCPGFLFNSLAKILAATQYCNAYLEILIEQLAMRKNVDSFTKKKKFKVIATLKMTLELGIYLNAVMKS